jgi:hypothetical protein
MGLRFSMTVPKAGEFWKAVCASVDSQPGSHVRNCEVGKSEGLTDQELKVVHVLALWSPSCADVAVLLLKGLEEELEGLLPVCSALNWEEEAFCDRHFDLCGV